MTIRAQMPADEASSLFVCCLVADPPVRVGSSWRRSDRWLTRSSLQLTGGCPSSELQFLAPIADRLYRVTFQAPYGTLACAE